MIYSDNGRRLPSLVKIAEKRIKHKVGKCIYNMFGSYIFLSGNKVLKVVESGEYHSYQKIKGILSWVKKTKPKHVVKIYDEGQFTISGRLHYFYVMEKLIPLPASYDTDLINIIENRVETSIELLKPKVAEFIVAFDNCSRTYVDLHERNVMMDRFGNYKLVDLEGFKGDNE